MLLSEILNVLFIYNKSNNLKGLTTLQKLENQFVIAQLKSFTDKANFQQRIGENSNSVLDKNEKQWLKDFLHSRWTRIQGTNSSYTQHSNLPSNKICVSLAKELAKTLHTQYLDLLMPGITGLANPFSILEYENDSHVSEFVMTENHMQLIHIDSALEQFEYSEKMTKREDIELSDLEQNAVIFHTPKTENYYNMLIEKRQIRNTNGTLGYALNQLRIALEHSSIDGNGEEFVAGQEIDNCRVEFSELISRLSPEHKSILFNSSFDDKQNKIVDFDYIWDVLTNASSRGTNAALCTKKIASQIKSLLDANFNLFQIEIQDNCIITIDEEAQNSKYQQIKENYQFEIQNEHEVIHSIYDKTAECKFIVPILSDEIGVKLFCANQTHFKFLLQLDNESKKLAIQALTVSNVGNKYLTKMMSSLSKPEKETIEQIISKFKSKSAKPIQLEIEKMHSPLIDFSKSKKDHISDKSIIIISDSESDDDEVQIVSKKTTSKKSKKRNDSKESPHKNALLTIVQNNSNNQQIPSLPPKKRLEARDNLESVKKRKITDQNEAPIITANLQPISNNNNKFFNHTITLSDVKVSSNNERNKPNYYLPKKATRTPDKKDFFTKTLEEMFGPNHKETPPTQKKAIVTNNFQLEINKFPNNHSIFSNSNQMKLSQKEEDEDIGMIVEQQWPK